MLTSRQDAMRIFSFAIGMFAWTPLEDSHKHSPNFLCKDRKGKARMKMNRLNLVKPTKMNLFSVNSAHTPRALRLKLYRRGREEKTRKERKDMKGKFGMKMKRVKSK